MIGPQNQPHCVLRDAGAVHFCDLPLTIVEASNSKLEQFVDIVLDHKWDKEDEFFETHIFKHIKEAEYEQLPAPFSLEGAPPVPFCMQIIMVHVESPEEADDPNAKYVHILKHVYLHKNKIPSNLCVQLCRGVCHRFDWGNNFRVGSLAANYMLDQMGGFQVRFGTIQIQAKVPKKNTEDNMAREQGYKFIREKGPHSNNRNQFMEWTDEQTHTESSPIQGWQEGKVVMALQNYMRGRQNAKH